MIALGVQLLIAAANLDLQAIPREPINSGAITADAAQRAATPNE